MTNRPPADREYVLGTHDAEIQRLFLQHSVWRPEVAAAWRSAGFTRGQHILDVGCGPGAATVDLADIVGPDGRVTAIDQSRRFLDYVVAQCSARGFTQVETREQDLASDDLELPAADGAWMRWVLAFVPDPRRLFGKVCAALRPGGRLVVHEYFNYESWRLLPADAGFERFVEIVMASWRSRGGEPNIGLSVPGWLDELGFRIVSTNTFTDVLTGSDYRWQWARAFILSGSDRLVELGELSRKEGERVKDLIRRVEQGGERMMTPGVQEIIAEKPGKN